MLALELMAGSAAHPDHRVPLVLLAVAIDARVDFGDEFTVNRVTVKIPVEQLDNLARSIGGKTTTAFLLLHAERFASGCDHDRGPLRFCSGWYSVG